MDEGLPHQMREPFAIKILSFGRYRNRTVLRRRLLFADIAGNAPDLPFSFWQSRRIPEKDSAQAEVSLKQC